MLGLGGCVSQDQGLSLEQTFGKPTFVALAAAPNHVVAPRAIAALPVAAGSVVTIRDHRYADGFRQDILLDGGAVRSIANGITVLAHEDKRQGQPAASSFVPLAKPTKVSVATELRTQFPGIGMAVVDRPFKNAYGPYGLALGRGDKDVRCLYAWQWIDDQAVLARESIAGPLSLRARLCLSGQSFDAMAAVMDGLVLGEAAALSSGSAIADDTTAVVSAPDVGDIRSAATPKTARPLRPMRKAQKSQHRRAVAETEAPPLATVASKTTGPRYLAPLTTPAAIQAAPVDPGAIQDGAIQDDAARDSAARAGRPTTLSGDLPPQAYLGPTAGPTKSPSTNPPPGAGH